VSRSDVATSSRAAAGDRGRLERFADGVWLDTQPVGFLGLRLTATMAVLQLKDGDVLLFSPITMTRARRAAVDAVGRVAHLYAPNLYHHLWLGEWAAAYPAARVHAPAGLSKKRPGLRVDRVHGAAPEPAFAGVVEELAIDGFRLKESVLFFQPARTLVVADLVHNVGRPPHRWTALYTRTMGFYGRVALSRMIRWAAFSDRRAARRSVDAVLAWPFERLVVGHGQPLTDEARAAVAAAYRWLPAATG